MVLYYLSSTLTVLKIRAVTLSELSAGDYDPLYVEIQRTLPGIELSGKYLKRRNNTHLSGLVPSLLMQLYSNQVKERRNQPDGQRAMPVGSAEGDFGFLEI